MCIASEGRREPRGERVGDRREHLSREQHIMMMSARAVGGIGESSDDDCCVCGDVWTEGQHGWLLCDAGGCENTVCPKCASTLSLSVSELFYCPMCAGSGQSAAATAGGAVATAVAACAELENLPLSFKTTKRI